MVVVVVVVLLGLFLMQVMRNRQDEAIRAQAAAELARQQAEEQLKKDQERIDYVVPTERIPKRTIISDRMVEVKSIEKRQAPWVGKPNAEAAYPKTLDEVVGRIALVELAPKEPLRFERLAAKDDLRAISFVITPGKRAVTIPMDAVRGVGGFIRQNDLVDIIGTFSLPDGRTLTRVLFQAAKVLIVDRTYVKENAPAPTTPEAAEAEKQQTIDLPGNPNQAYANIAMVTFELPPADAEKLVLTSARIPLSLSLRNPGDAAEVPVEDSIASDDDVFRDPKDPVKDPPTVVEVLTGGIRTYKELDSR